MIKVILWDIDGTLLDFKKNESNSIKNAFRVFSLGECSDDTVKLYSDINQSCWEMLERGELTKEQTLIVRFEKFFDELDIKGVSPREFCSVYENGIADTTAFIDGAYDTVSSLRGKYKQYAVTNGAYSVQTERLKRLGLGELFDGVFISDKVGYEKPSPLFFDYVRKHIDNVSLDEILIVGDSLTSDIKGGNNMGIKTCLFSPKPLVYDKNEYKINYVISSLDEIDSVLEKG